MCTRLIVNITQVYIPMYALETLLLSKDTIAKIPLVIYVSGFLSTFLSKPLNKCYGRKGTFFLGILMTGGVSAWMYYIKERDYTSAYGASALLGVGGSTVLVTALTMLADLIGENVETGAFVYGAMSFTDKLSNGLAIQLIQIFHPCNKLGETCCAGCKIYYKEVMVFVTGGATIISLLVLISMLKTKIGDFEESGELETNVQDKLLGQNASVSTSVSRSVGSPPNQPSLVYEPSTPPRYGSLHGSPHDVPCSIQEDFASSQERARRNCER